MRWLPLSILFLALVGPVQAREQWEGSLSEARVDELIRQYRRDPGALTRNREALRRISSQQLHRLIASLDTTHFTYLYPISLQGYRFGEHQGTALDTLSLMAVRGGEMKPIPFQFDEFDKTGLVWIAGKNRAEPGGEPGILDEFDELVFMYRDGGHERYAPQRHDAVEGEIMREIRLDSPRNRPRYVYLVRGNPRRSDADYVHADIEAGHLETTVLELDYNPNNFIDIKHAAARIGPHHGRNVFDAARLKISTGLFNRNIRVGLDTGDNIRVKPVAVKDGPVRVNLHVKARIWYLYMPTFFSRTFNVNLYEQAVRIPSRVAIDSVRTLKRFMLFLREPRIRLSTDFHNLEGAKVTFQAVHDNSETGVVDGKMDNFEQRMADTRLPGDWLFMDSNQGWQLFFSNHLPVVPGGLFDAFLQGTKLSMIYRDNADSEADWERYPGAMPRFGVAGEGLPRIMLRLINAVPKLDFREMDTLGDALIALESAAREDNALKKYDQIVSEVLQRLYDQGRITSVKQLADAFMADLRRMHFKGVPREQFNALIHDSIVQAVDDPTHIDHGQLLTRILQLAGQRGIPVKDIRYATMDNTLWLPDWVGPGGPEDFHRQVQRAPEATLRPWVGPSEPVQN